MRLVAALAVALPVAFAVAWGEPGWPAFALAGALGAVLAARAPTVLAGLLCALGSADLWLKVDVGGFTFRAGHLWSVALLAAAVGQAPLTLLWRFARSRPGLGLWLGPVLLGAAHLAWGVPNPGKALGYVLWGVFDVGVMALAVAWHARQRPLVVLGVWVLASVAVACFGLTQFLMPLSGVEPVAVQQWIGGTRPRLNGLSYEPSYFAFQAMIPTTLLVTLLVRGFAARLPRLALPLVWCATLLMAAMALSSSRSAWAGLFILALGAAVAVVWSGARGHGWPRTSQWRAWSTVVAAGLVLWVLTPVHAFEGDRIIASRTTNVDDPSSAQPRREGIVEAWRMFVAHPLVGVGPGQFGGTLLAHPEFLVRTIPVGQDNPDQLVTFNLYAELLAESGVLGCASVLLGVALALRALWIQRGQGPSGAVAWALLMPLLLTFGAMYQLNQTLWRAEVWCLLGLAWSRVPWRAHASGHAGVQAL